ncbi:sulfurtransferase [Microbacterium sp. CFBP9034]|uniref:sulfurtransferase n=1 Tax=Microbacterium sp. CFBP9034 TaxID=3096540 RepID=UPI002A6B7685|nr:sulfurtransferase [Microbacterium sp. CFBP9034]MDY0910996.1 sulfurtransferase [Microbacterium sp. CFBP9034]
MPLLVTPAQLAALRDSAPRVAVLDVRWRLDRPDGHPDYLAGHIPGAVWVDLDRELASHHAPEDGRHPLPSLETLQAAARRWGLDDGDVVVVYDDWNSLAAARAWWLLRRSGVADVRVLDGGFRAWTDAGHPLETDDVVPEPGAVTLKPILDGVLTTDGAAQWPAAGVLLDSRAPERYRGDVEPLDPRAGHIPGARNLPAAAVLEAGRFRDAAALRAAFAEVGATPDVPVAAYCGSGITAAHTALAGALAGLEVTVYPGSWSAWSNTPGRPVATGAEPGAPG